MVSAPGDSPAELPAGRYRLEIRVLSVDGHTVAADAMKVYIYPEQH